MKIRIKNIFAALLLSVFTFNAFCLCWNGEKDSSKWQRTVRMKKTVQKDHVLLSSDKKDPCIFLSVGKADLRKFAFIEIQYRVTEKIASGNNPVIYYKGEKEKKHSGAAIKLGKWVDDGSPQTKKIPLDAAHIVNYAGKWQKTESFGDLRFDPFAEKGSIEIKSICFLDASGTRKTAAVKKDKAAEKKQEIVKADIKDFLEKTQGGKFVAFSGKYKVAQSNAYEGKVCMEQGDDTDNESIAQAKAVLPVKPNSRYLLKVWARNTIPVGQVLFSCVQSRSAEEKKGTSYLDRGWTQVPCNMDKWTQCELPVQTKENTYGLIVYFHVFNRGVGKAWWDKLTLEEVVDRSPAVTANDYPLFASFTDRPVKIGQALPVPGKKNRSRVQWKTLDEKKEPLVLSFNKYMPADGNAVVRIIRGKKEYYSSRRKVKENQSYILPLSSLPEGRYKLCVTGEKDGKELCRLEKDLWKLVPIPEQKTEKVKNSSVLAGKGFAAINGKPFYPIYFSHFPGMHINPDPTHFPDVETHIANMREILNINVFHVITMKSGPNRKKLPREEYLRQTTEFYVKSYLAQLDFCLKNNLYAVVSLHMGSALVPKGKCDYELTENVIRRIKRHPAIFMYSYDEPEPRKVTPDEIRKLYATVKKADPDHIVCINLCVKNTFHKYGRCSDIASYDFYPFPHSDLNYWRLYNQTIKEANPGAPLRTYLQIFQFLQSRFPTHDEVFASFVAGLIDGNYNLTVYAWFSNKLHSMTTHIHMQSTGRVLANYGIRLSDFLFRAAAKEWKLAADKEILYKYFEKGNEGCLLVVNTSNRKKSSLALPAGKMKITDFFDPAWEYPTGKKYTLAPYETMILKIKK